MTNISIIVPIFNLYESRLENFNFTLKRISKLNIPIYISEQNGNQIVEGPNINYYNSKIDDNVIHKSKLINHVSQFITTEYLWLLDADCCLKFQEVLDQIKNQNVIKPFKYIIPLTRSETKKLVNEDQLYIKKSKREISTKFGAYSFIIKKEIFDKIGMMNENFTGYGWEDIEFASRVKEQYSVHQLNLSGLHLYHPIPTENPRNKILFLSILKENSTSIKDRLDISHLILQQNKEIHDQINLNLEEEIHDKIDVDNLNKSVKDIQNSPIIKSKTEKHSDVNINKLLLKELNVDKLLKKKLNVDKLLKKKLNIDKLIKSTEKDKIPTAIDILVQKLLEHLNNKDQNKDELNVKKTKIIHTITPALLETKTELYNREMLAIESIIDEKKLSELDIITIIISNNPNAQKFKDNFIIIPPLRTAQDIGDKKDLPYISDIFKIMSDMGDDETVLFYTNSDCCIGEGTYQKLLKYNKQAIEYHRNDVENNPVTLTDMFKNDSSIHITGVDGLALSKIFYELNKQYISDFFIGEPHWDTAVGGFLRNFNLSTLNTIDLFHPKHDKTWDLKNLTIAGQHNTDLYREFLEYGFLKNHILELPKHYTDIDTNVVIVHFGKSDIRVKTVKTTLDWLAIQELPVEYIFVEMVYGEEAGAFEYLKNRKHFKYIKLIGNEQNKIIWQKEAMMNVGAKNADKKFVIFLDSDVYSKRSNWFNRIRDHLELNPNSLMQIFKFCNDSIYPEQMFVSLAAKWNQYDTDAPHNPGLAIAINRDILVKNNYFNPYCIYGSGDTCIVAEYCRHDSFLFTYDRFKNIKRSLPIHCSIDYLDEDIIHENHGELVSLNYYRDRHLISKHFAKEMKELVKFDENGLLSWVDDECQEKMLITELYKNKFK